MYVEELQRLGLVAPDLPADRWEGEERLDQIWLHAADHWLRRALLVDGRGDFGPMAPDLDDVRIAGASSDCALLDPDCWPAPAKSPDDRVAEVFLYTGDLIKWGGLYGDRLGEPEEYRSFAQTLAQAAREHWDLPREPIDEFSRLQALLWSVQSLRLANVGPRAVGDAAARVGLRGLAF